MVSGRSRYLKALLLVIFVAGATSVVPQQAHAFCGPFPWPPCPPAPTASLTASPSTVTQGQTTTLFWSSTNATSCTGSGFSTGAGSPPNGNAPVGPLNTLGSNNFQVTCTGAGGSASSIVTVTVNSPPSSFCGWVLQLPGSPPAWPTCQDWNPNDNCVLSACNNPADDGATCTNGHGGYCNPPSPPFSAENPSDTIGTSVCVCPAPPTITFTATPPTVTQGNSSTLSWSASNATSCTGSGFSTGAGSPTSGSASTGALNTVGTDSYSVSCTGPGGPSSQSVTVTVNPPASCSATTMSNCDLPASASGTSVGSCSAGYIGSCNYSCSNGTWSKNSNTCSLPAGCPATTISNCSLPATASGSSSGSCSAGYSGACNYSCSNGTWSANTNSCAPAACANGANNPPTCDTCTAPNVYDGSSCVAPLSITSNPVAPITLPSTAFTETYTLSGGTSANTNCRLLDNLGSALTAYAPCTGSIGYNTPNAPGTYGYSIEAEKASTGEDKISNPFTITVNPAAPTNCPATTISNCSLPATASGSSAGSCSAGYSGACNYSCSNGTWSVVSNSCVVLPPAPTATFSASPSTVTQGQSSTLTWSSSNATSCTGTGFSTGAGSPTSGSVSTGALNSVGNYPYQLSCTGPGGSSPIYNASVTVNASATATITASPTQVKSGGSTTIAWSSTGATTCSVTKNGAAWQSGTSNSGVIDSNITGSTIYTITCDNGAAPKSVTVTIAPVFETF